MAHAEIELTVRGIEITVLAEGCVTSGGSNYYGSDEPAWQDIEDIRITRPCGRALSDRLESAIVKDHYEYICDVLLEADS